MDTVKATVFKHERYLTEKHILSILRWHLEGTARGLDPRSTLLSRDSTLEAAEDRKPVLRCRACAVRMEFKEKASSSRQAGSIGLRGTNNEEN